MFHSVELANAIHVDRVREIERTSRERRLMRVTDEGWAAPELRALSKVSSADGRPLRQGRSACEPA
jgi:hypothetical protein